ncbi:glycosyltransferase family 2 protein [Blastococcus sp. SYSU DS0552]
MSSSANGPSGISVVIATRDRRESLLRTLAWLDSPGSPPITVVDNGSTDGSPAAVRTAHPRVTVRRLGENRGAVARNVGIAAAATPYVVFSDDDSWWAPGALERAAEVPDAHPGVAVLVGRVRLAADGSDDAVSSKMARAPIGHRLRAPGPDVLGFSACAAVVRRDAFLAVGGSPRFSSSAGRRRCSLSASPPRAGIRSTPGSRRVPRPDRSSHGVPRPVGAPDPQRPARRLATSMAPHRRRGHRPAPAAGTVRSVGAVGPRGPRAPVAGGVVGSASGAPGGGGPVRGRAPSPPRLSSSTAG